MAKSAGQNTVFTWGLSGETPVEIGVTEFEISTNISELDATDTKTTAGESEYLGGKQERTISFTILKDATVDGLDLNTATVFSVAVTDADSKESTYSGSAVLLTETVTGSVDGIVTVQYTGRVTGALGEAQT